MYERNPYDRRRAQGRHRFPLTDSNGQVIAGERRAAADRRLAGIASEWDAMPPETGWAAAPLPHARTRR